MDGKGLLLVLAIAASCATTKSTTPTSPEIAAEPQVDHLVPNPTLPPRAYTDGLGIVVEIVPLHIPDGESPRALLRITGVPNFIAGVTFVATRDSHDDEEDFWATPIDGRPSRLVHTRQNRARDVILLTLPRLRQRFELQHDPAASAAIDVDALIEDHRQHVADGSIAKLAEFDREYLQSGGNDKLRKTQTQLRRACGKDINVAMDWDRVKTSDDFTQAHFCAMSLEAITSMCELSLSTKDEIAQKVNAVRCRLQHEQEFLFEESPGVLSVHSNMETMATPEDAMAAATSALKLHRTVLKSQSGLYVVLPVLQRRDEKVYAGISPQLYAQIWAAGSAGKHFSTWDGARSIDVTRREPGLWDAECKYGDVELREVGIKERDQVLSTARFEPRLWNRELFALARDDHGIYYYVDRLDKLSGGVGYRVFKGPRGKLALTKMVDIVDDSRGKIFSTTAGNLRLVLSGENPVEARWISGKRERPLVVLKRFAALRFVYGELGVYDGEDLGTICSLAQAATDRK